MFKNKDIVCISTISWDFLRQRHQIFMQRFAEEGNRVFYIENPHPTLRWDLGLASKVIRRLAKICPAKEKQIPGLSVITPLVIPFKNRIAQWLNKNIFLPCLAGYLKRKIKNPVLVWTYLATSTVLKLIDILKPEAVIYDCVFDARIHPDSPKDIVESDKKMIAIAKLVLTDSRFLLQRCKEINPSTRLILPGVDFTSFAHPLCLKAKNLLHGITWPRLCFFGGIDQIRLDLELLVYLAQKKPEWNILLFGPVIKTDISCLKLKNIFLKETLPHLELPGYLAEMDVLLLPYKIIPFSKSIFPAKIFECLASGKPIVATPLEELNSLGNGLIQIAQTKEDFVSLIELALRLDPKTQQAKRLAAAEENSWEQRFKSLGAIITELKL